MAALALRGELYLHTRACEDCPHVKQRALLDENLAALNAFLGAERFQKQIRLKSRKSANRLPPENCSFS